MGSCLPERLRSELRDGDHKLNDSVGFGMPQVLAPGKPWLTYQNEQNDALPQGRTEVGVHPCRALTARQRRWGFGRVAPNKGRARWFQKRDDNGSHLLDNVVMIISTKNFWAPASIGPLRPCSWVCSATFSFQ